MAHKLFSAKDLYSDAPLITMVYWLLESSVKHILPKLIIIALEFCQHWLLQCTSVNKLIKKSKLCTNPILGQSHYFFVSFLSLVIISFTSTEMSHSVLECSETIEWSKQPYICTWLHTIFAIFDFRKGDNFRTRYLALFSWIFVKCSFSLRAKCAIQF